VALIRESWVTKISNQVWNQADMEQLTTCYIQEKFLLILSFEDATPDRIQRWTAVEIWHHRIRYSLQFVPQFLSPVRTSFTETLNPR